MSFRVEVIASEEKFVAIREVWDEIVLSDSERHTSFQTWTYLFNHWKFRKSGEGFHRELRIFVVYDNSLLIAIAPLWVNTVHKGLKIRILEFIGNRGIDYLNLIFRNGINHDKVTSLLMNKILADSSWDVISLSELVEKASISIGAAIKESGTSYSRMQCGTCVRINIPNTKNEYLMKIGKSTRKRLIYDCKRLESMYDANLKVHVAYNDEFIATLDILQEIYQQKWCAENRISSNNKRYAKLMDSEINKGLAENGSLRYFVLSAQGRPIAGMSCAVQGKTIFAHIMSVSMDHEYKRFSPGMVMMKKTIDWAIDNDYQTLDMSRGAEPYKFSLGGIAFPNYRITVCRNLVFKAIINFARNMGRPI